MFEFTDTVAGLMTTLMTQAGGAGDAAAAAEAGNASLSSHFDLMDWGVLIGYMVLVTWMGVKLAGKQESMEDFFRGGNKLPWYAVSASMIATTISAVTFVGVPSVAFAGNFTYLQLGLIAGLISRIFVSFVLVPAYYENKVYSPYDYMGDKLGFGAKEVTTGLFTLGGLLAQSARVYLTALILALVMDEQLGWIESVTGISPLASAIILVTIIAIIWTMIGGIATVVWTDALLFLVFVIGAIASIWVISAELPEGFGQLVEVGQANDKFVLFDFSKAFDLTEPYTLFAAGFAVVIGNIGVYGTDQLLAQRLFCCRNEKSAKLAVMSSYAAEFIAGSMLLVGVGLFAFYAVMPERMNDANALLVAKENDKIFPVFILTEMPAGVKGLVIAGIFAAAVSSLTSILAALAQTSISAVYLPRLARRLGTKDATEQSLIEAEPKVSSMIVSVSRKLIVVWGIALGIAAFAIDAFKSSTNVPILDLALALASYIVGGLFAAFLLAWLPMKINGRGLIWAAPLSVMMVLAARFHEQWAWIACGGVGGILIISWILLALKTNEPGLRQVRLLKTAWLVVGVAILMMVTMYGQFTMKDKSGQVLRADAVAVDDTGEPIVDTEPVAVSWLHPATKEPLLDEQGEPTVRGFAKRTLDGEVMLDGKGMPQLQGGDEPVFWVAQGGEPIKKNIAWPWYAVIGALVSFVFGFLLAEKKEVDHVVEAETKDATASDVNNLD